MKQKMDDGASSSEESLKSVVSGFLDGLGIAASMKGKVVDPESGVSFREMVDSAATLDLIRFCAEMHGLCNQTPYEPFNKDWIGRFAGGFSNGSVVYQVLSKKTHFKPFLVVASKAVSRLSRDDLIAFANNEHSMVMSYIMAVTKISSKEFVRTDEKGREDQLGIELGL